MSSFACKTARAALRGLVARTLPLILGGCAARAPGSVMDAGTRPDAAVRVDAGRLSPASHDASTAADAASAKDAGQDAGTLNDQRMPGMPMPPSMGGPGCGLSSAAFCDRFETPSEHLGRAGELDSRLWSAGRVAPQFATGNGVAIGIGPGALPPCRKGLPSEVYPSLDALICDPNDDIADHHLVVVAAAQNYGQSSYRIRQPFDFADRVGTIAFDAEGFVQNQLIGWISLDVTEDPVNAPSFSIAPNNNDEGSQWPRSGFEVQYQVACVPGDQQTGFALRFIATFDKYVMTMSSADKTPCVPTKRGKLNHFEIRVSQKKIEVYASSYSEDGVKFPDMQLLQSVDVQLPFTRGYVQISTHNHASLKYSEDKLDAWSARWNNVGFDGPIIKNWREYEIPDKLEKGEGAWNRSGPIVSVGYRLPDVSAGPHDVLRFKSVDLTNVVRARLSTSTYYPYWEDAAAKFTLRYRLNAGAWHDRVLDAGELSVMKSPATQGQIMQLIDLPLQELIQGDNTLELVTANVGQGYPAAVANIDLVLETR